MTSFLAQGLSRDGEGIPDDEGLDAIESINTTALVRGNDGGPIVDAEVIEPEFDSTDLPPSSKADRAGHAGRRTYTLSDF